MTLKSIPAFNFTGKVKDKEIDWDLRADALEKWKPGLKAAVEDRPSISIYEQIGLDPWDGSGVTVKRIDAALRSIGDREVDVNINSPGGNFFEGLAIYNRLREHKARVNVRIFGLAASAASAVAMAGDEILIGKSAFMMIHNVWGVVIGNRHDLRSVAADFDEFDRSLAGIYADVSGQSVEAIGTLLDAETWMSGARAIEEGLATGELAADAAKEEPESADAAAFRKARAEVERVLQAAGKSRAERKRLLQAMFSGGKPGAATEGAKPGAGADDEWSKAALQLAAAMAG